MTWLKNYTVNGHQGNKLLDELLPQAKGDHLEQMNRLKQTPPVIFESARGRCCINADLSAVLQKGQHKWMMLNSLLV
ncbi:hypothetical protein BN59_01539 [Legionella massiliensis]|uniref:Uncharacterized protein n=1 Tax=Legionella massiliensis TaxID=1034943 RepID=A0A078KW74_9GAMM|nr:hypothetical protein [Legionella massiliensis]CDZ77257.1 hypothetical protein BN59_01539 [Legionella massiliensis]CEE12995.1 hypothetical protein BN1094_01539 [Legionella massiliensis]